MIRTTTKRFDSRLRGFLSSLTSGNINLSVQLNYVSDGDANGVFYFLGTQRGISAWANPFPSSGQAGNTWTNAFTGVVMSVSGYLTGQTDPPGITDTAASHVHINAAGHWVMWDFGASSSLVVTKWNLRNRDNSADGATSVVCEGSQDGLSWTTLNLNPARSAAINVWDGGIATDVTPWRFVRIRQTADVDYFTIGEIELYGTYTSAS